MTGHEVMEKVRALTGDHTFSRSDEIVLAMQEITRGQSASFLRVIDDDLVKFRSGRSDYLLDAKEVDRVLSVSVKGTTAGNIFWHLMRESGQEQFNDRLKETLVRETGAVETDRPEEYRLLGGDQSTLHVTPTPGGDYTVRVEYIRALRFLPERELPLPQRYHQAVVLLAAGMVMHAMGDEHSERQGNRFRQLGREAVAGLVRDAAPNRRGRIQPPRMGLLNSGRTR